MSDERGRIQDLIYDWNGADGPHSFLRHIEFDDETLRDGLQSPSATDPSIGEKIELLHLMAKLGIQSADIGLPGAGPRAEADALVLAKEIADNNLPIRPNCAARTMVRDIEPIVRISEKAGIAVEASTFIGSSPIRIYTESWSVEKLLEHTRTAIEFAVKQGLPVMYVTEDTTRAHPDTLRKLYSTAIECGAARLCIADTVGHSIPTGVRSVVRFVRGIVEESGRDVHLDWHGHCDRGTALLNAVEAIEAGVTRVHGTALGVGERCGNLPLDLLLVNLRLLGWIDNDLSSLNQYCRQASMALDVPIPPNYPVFGRDAFRTATGVHAAAVIKAFRRGDTELADWVYSGVPAGMFGRQQRIDVGPMSGASNVHFWLERHGFEIEEELVQSILGEAKSSKKTLSDKEIQKIIDSHRKGD